MTALKPTLFLDRDGVVNTDYGYVYEKENFHFISGIFDLVSYANTSGYYTVIITNQSGIGRGYYSETDFNNLMTWVSEQFTENNAWIDRIYYSPYHPTHGQGPYRKQSDCRKPGTGMIIQAEADLEIDMAKSILIGDKMTDMVAGQTAGIGTLFCLDPEKKVPELPNWATRIFHLQEALVFLKNQNQPELKD